MNKKQNKIIKPIFEMQEIQNEDVDPIEDILFNRTISFKEKFLRNI